MTLTYARELSKEQAVQALTESHPLWGGVSTAGLGAVFTSEARRRQGLAELLIKTVLEERYAEGAGAAWLFSDIAPAYYAKQGFKAFPAVTSSLDTARLPKEEPFDTRPAAASERDGLRAWYEADAPAGCLRPLRSERVWDFFRELNGSGPDLVLSRGGVEVGYLSVCPSGEKLWVEEWAAPGEDEARVWATVRARAEEQSLAFVGSWLPPWCAARGASRAVRTRSIPMLAAAPGLEGLLEHPPEGAHFGSLDHF